MAASAGSDGGSDEKARQRDHAEGDRSQLPALPLEGFVGEGFLDFEAEIALRLDPLLEDLDGIGNDGSGHRFVGLVLGVEAAARGADRGKAEQEDE